MSAQVSVETAFRSALAIEGAETLDRITQEIRSFCAPLGYDRFVLFSASAARDEVVERIYWVEGDWFGDGRDVDAETYIRRCPVRRHMLDQREPFFWIKNVVATGETYRVIRTPRGPGIFGYQVPIFGPTGLEGAVSLGGNRIDATPPTRLALKLIAEAAFLAARKLLESPAGTGVEMLSGREREVLSWTAAGRRQAEIAAALGLSERTIENHLRRIRKRLAVTTTAQAIRVAIRNGDISG